MVMKAKSENLNEFYTNFQIGLDNKGVVPPSCEKLWVEKPQLILFQEIAESNTNFSMPNSKDLSGEILWFMQPHKSCSKKKTRTVAHIKTS